MQPECSPRRPLFSAPARAALLLAVGLAGCTTSVPDPPPPRPFEGVTLTVACPDDASAALVERHGRAWADRTGGAVAVSRTPAAPGADAWLIAPADLATHAAAGKLWPLPDSSLHGRDGYDWDGQIRLYRDKLLRWGTSTVYAVPVLGEAPVCLYRADLFRDPKHREGFEKKFGRLLPAEGPATWQEFAEVADYFREALQGPSLPPLPADDDHLDRLFFSVAAPLARRGQTEEWSQHGDKGAGAFAFHYDPQGHCRLADPGFVEALKLLQRLQKCRAADGTPREAFRSGKAVLWLTTLDQLGELGAGGAPRGRVGVCRRLPGSAFVIAPDGQREEVPNGNYVPYVGAGGRLGVVPAAAAHREAALDLLTELAGPRVSLEVLAEPRWGGGPTREVHLDPAVNRYCWSAYGLNDAGTSALADALRQAVQPPPSNPVLRLRTPDQAPHTGALVEELRKALATDADPAQAMRTVAKRWRELDEGKPLEERKRDYLRSLSLVP